jgi:hypothetical protein
LLIDIVICRRWGTLAWAALSGTLIWLASLALLGPSTFLTYFSSPPTSRVPQWAYVEPINQSLLAMVLRGRTHWASTGSPVTEPWFLALGAALAVATIWLAYQARRCRPELGLALSLVMGLLLYPGTLAHYALVLVIPLLTIWALRDDLPGKALGLAILAGLIYGLVGFAQGNTVFVAHLLTWISLALAITFLAWKKEQAQ